MAQSLIEHGRIKTTLAKARNIRPFLERLVTLAVKARTREAAGDVAGGLRARRAIHKLLGDRGMIPAGHRSTYEGMSDAARAKTMRMTSGRRHRTGEPKGRLAFTGESITHRLLDTVAARYEGRPGGYTRLIRLSDRRLGDNSPLAVVQLVGEEKAPMSLTKPQKSARRRRADARYAMAVRVAKGWSGRGRPEIDPPEPSVDAGTDAKRDDEGENWELEPGPDGGQEPSSSGID